MASTLLYSKTFPHLQTDSLPGDLIRPFDCTVTFYGHRGDYGGRPGRIDAFDTCGDQLI